MLHAENRITPTRPELNWTEHLMEQMSFQLVAMGLRDHKLDSVSMATNIRSVFEYNRAGRVYKSAYNDIEQQTQLHTNYRNYQIGFAC